MATALSHRLSARRAVVWILATLLYVVVQPQSTLAQQEIAAVTPTPSITPTPTPTPSTTPLSCGPRVRKAWGSLTTTEKQLYLDAVMVAMSTGMHTLFFEVHGDTVSGNEAHLTGGMIYWHRRFLLAYENMLRSLEPRFACVTVPYWDYFADFAKRTAGFCTTLEGCSTFLSEFGGSNGPTKTQTVGTSTLTSNCVTSGVPPGTILTYANATTSTNFTVSTSFNLSGFCESSSIGSASCAQCIPRGTWKTTPFPSGFGYASLAKLVSGSYGFALFAQNLHYGVHNSIHNAAGSTVATLSTCADPIFYNHHATVDLVHQMWYDCQVKRPMTEYEKKNSNYAFAAYSQSAGVASPTALSTITQYWSNATARIRADDHPVIGQFFSPLPTEYWQYVSGTDLGAYSYTYEKDGLLDSFTNANTAISCPALSKARRTQEVTDRQFAPFGGKAADPQRVVAVAQVNGLGEELANNIMEVVVEQNREDTMSKKVLRAVKQMELMECAWYVEQGNYVDDFTDFYKESMGMPADAHTNCYNLMMKLLEGEENIALDNWREVFKRYLRSAKHHTISSHTTSAPAATSDDAPVVDVAATSNDAPIVDVAATLDTPELAVAGSSLTVTEEAAIMVPNEKVETSAALAGDSGIVEIDLALTSNI